MVAPMLTTLFYRFQFADWSLTKTKLLSLEGEGSLKINSDGKCCRGDLTCPLKLEFSTRRATREELRCPRKSRRATTSNDLYFSFFWIFSALPVFLTSTIYRQLDLWTSRKLGIRNQEMNFPSTLPSYSLLMEKRRNISDVKEISRFSKMRLSNKMMTTVFSWFLQWSHR